MTSIDVLLQFLVEHRWETASDEEIAEVLGNARREIEEQPTAANDGRIERLRQIESGNASNADFQGLIDDWRRLEREGEMARLKPEMLATAAALPDDEWETNLYWRIYDAILAFKEGDKELLLATAASIRELLTSAWDNYAQQNSLVEGTSAVAELGNQMLEDSFTLFHSAVDEMEDAANDDGGSLGQALRCAETASRRMMAVQLMNKKVLAKAAERNGKT